MFVDNLVNYKFVMICFNKPLDLQEDAYHDLKKKFKSYYTF